MSIAPLLAHDARLQVRQGFYLAYVVLTAAYVLLLRQLPPDARATLAPLVVFSDPAVFGFFGVGAMLLLERDEGVHAALFTTRATPAAYVVAKSATFSLLAVLTSFAIAVGAALPFAAPTLLAGVALSAALFVQLGIIAGCWFRTFNRFALGGGLALLVLSLPLLPFFALADAPALALLPSYASLVLIGGAFGVQAAVPQPALCAAVWLCVCAAAAGALARTVVARRLATDVGA